MKSFRGRMAHVVTTSPLAWEYLADGVLVVNEGRVTDFGPAERFVQQGFDLATAEPIKGLLLPGFIDTHVHSPQIDVIGSYGEQLLDWLDRYTFPAEMAFKDETYAAAAAGDFLDSMLRAGTTTASVYVTIHRAATDALFADAKNRNLRLIAGKVLMDQNAPAGLCDDLQGGIADSRALIEQWHGNGRLGYAITPRFAVSSTAAQMAAAGELHRQYPDTWVQTHLSENPVEIAKVAELYPDRSGYLDVYDHFGLLTDRSVFGHCLHLSDEEVQRMSDAGGKVAFCPSSNLFLGSGLLDVDKLQAKHIDVALASDVGGGTSLSMLQTMGDAYKVCRMAGQTLSPMAALSLATLAAAEALRLDSHVGNFKPGKEADMVCLGAEAGSLLERRLTQVSDIEEEIFLYMTLGGEVVVRQTYIAGETALEAA